MAIPLLWGTLFLFQFFACASIGKQQAKEDVQVKPISVEERWGVDSFHIRPTAANFSFDFQYRVLGPPNAVLQLDRHKIMTSTSGKGYDSASPGGLLC